MARKAAKQRRTRPATARDAAFCGHQRKAECAGPIHLIQVSSLVAQVMALFVSAPHDQLLPAPRVQQERQAATTRALCLALHGQGITTIGLNVTADNAAAISMYERLGFRTVMEFVECDVEPRGAEGEPSI